MSLDSLGAYALCAFTKALTGARMLWLGCAPAAARASTTPITPAMATSR